MRYKPGKIDRHSLASVGTLVLELARRRCRSCSVCTPFHQPIATVPLYEDVRRSLEPTAIRKFFGTGRSSIQWPDLNFRVAGFPRRLPALFGFRLAFRALRRPRNISPRRSCPELAFFCARIGTESRNVHLCIITVHLFRASVAERSSGSRLSSEKARSTWSQPPCAATAASR
jgi:hypothetical protein